MLSSARIAISRPRFWSYLFGPFLIGLAAAPDIEFSLRLLALGLFFTYPANLLIYGFNDVFDYETDKHNPKKRGYEKLLSPEQRTPLLRHMALLGLIGILLVTPADVPQVVKWAMTGFYFFGLGYSVPPIRAKAKPFLDAYFNVLYVFPALVSYGLLTGNFPPLELFIAGALWCAAMHAYSAVPDIRADKKAGLKTVATVLGAKRTLIFCTAHYLLAALLSFPWIGVFSVLAGAVYLWLMYASLRAQTHERLFQLYTYFPRVNLLVGAALFFWVLNIVNI